MKSAFSTRELDEAAVWIARLRGPERSPRLENGFRRWLREKPSHRAAFETVSSAWELTGGLQRRPAPRKIARAQWLRAGAAVSASVLIALGVLFLRANDIITRIGEQRTVLLEDGTRVSLNTASRMSVDYDERERGIHLKSGEALFEVAREARRPFVVYAAGRRIQALGTTFVVRDDTGRLAVTLMEGKVAISEQAGAVEEVAAETPVVLNPGERLVLAEGSPPQLDRPSIAKVTAWRNGQLDLDDMPLEEAAREFNRYSAIRLLIETPQAAALPINGIFRAGDTAGFAAAVASSYGLKLQRRGNEIILRGVPSARALSEESLPPLDSVPQR